MSCLKLVCRIFEIPKHSKVFLDELGMRVKHELSYKPEL